MNPSRSLPAASSVDLQDLSPIYGPHYGSDVAQPAPRADKAPSVGKLFARMFGAGAADAHHNTFAQTEWMDTVWEETRSLPLEP